MNNANQADSIRIEMDENTENIITEKPFKVEREEKEEEKNTKDTITYEAFIADIDTNKKAAIKYVPDAHRETSLIFIKCEINGEIIKAVVDTGASHNFMTATCAKRCYLTSLINTTFCCDIGTSTGRIKSLAVVHFYPLTIENITITASFIVMKSNLVDMALGIRTLNEYQCAIDMKTRTLSFDKISTYTPFLKVDEIRQFQEEELYVKRYEELNKSKQDEMDVRFKAAKDAGHFNKIPRKHVTCLVNGHPVNAVLDSGAYRTHMSKSCAERCGILKLTDSERSVITFGAVASTQSLGLVHFCPIQIEDNILYTSVDIMDTWQEMLLGLDVLERYHCTINLKINTLCIGRTATEVNSSDGVGSTKRKRFDIRGLFRWFKPHKH